MSIYRQCISEWRPTSSLMYTYKKTGWKYDSGKFRNASRPRLVHLPTLDLKITKHSSWHANTVGAASFIHEVPCSRLDSFCLRNRDSFGILDAGAKVCTYVMVVETSVIIHLCRQPSPLLLHFCIFAILAVFEYRNTSDCKRIHNNLAGIFVLIGDSKRLSLE